MSEQQSQDNGMMTLYAGLLAVPAIFGIMWVLVMAGDPSNRRVRPRAAHASTSTRPAPPAIDPGGHQAHSIGAIRRLRQVNETLAVPLCTDPEALRQLGRASAANDRERMQELMQEERVWMTFAGTKVKVIGSGGLLGSFKQVKILEGNHAGKAFWVLASLLK